MKTDGYNVDWYDYTSDHDGGKRYGVKIQDLRRYQGVTLSGFASIPERDAAVREWIERQEQKPVIVPGPVVRNVEHGKNFVALITEDLSDLQSVLAMVHPWARAEYDDDANHQHGVRIAERRRELLTELIGSYRAELGVIQAQLKELEEHGGS